MVDYPETWWKDAVIYQIYPISFFDSNGDGIGDLNGIASKLDYLKDLGVDVLWLSPIYRSPLADMGYDISDFRNIDPRYGTLEDWDRLLAGVHARGMKLMMDLVVNHTSDEHEWFIESKSSKTSPKRDWYIWRPPRYDEAGNRHPPNNWEAVFQGSVWEYDSNTNEYYLHLFLSKQPDLNWENPEVRQAVWDLMTFWVDRGCDGFRMDVINLISKVDGLPDAPVTIPGDEYQDASLFFADGPHVHEYIQEMNLKVLSKHDLITVGETPFTHSAAELAKYVLPANKELNMVFQFELVYLDSPRTAQRTPFIHRPWKLSEFKEIVTRWQRFERDAGFWNACVLPANARNISSDWFVQPRSISRWGNDSEEWRAVSAKLLAVLEVTLGGTQYVFQGEDRSQELPAAWGIEEYKDVASQNWYHEILEKRKRESGKDEKARDHGRVPMQWNSSAHAGFTTGTPWMRVNEDYETWNAAAQVDDEKSVRAFWKRALQLRKDHKVLIYGDFTILAPENEEVIAYTRSYKNAHALILLNFTSQQVLFALPQGKNWSKLGLAFGNYAGIPDGQMSEVELKAYEGRVYLGS
ncbi:glycoside hydrolase family 13 protein [Mycena leptocephala]|nr:glycoside hydrolase family 13 protein [Mycena leptocephala]